MSKQRIDRVLELGRLINRELRQLKQERDKITDQRAKGIKHPGFSDEDTMSYVYIHEMLEQLTESAKECDISLILPIDQKAIHNAVAKDYLLDMKKERDAAKQKELEKQALEQQRKRDAKKRDDDRELDSWKHWQN